MLPKALGIDVRIPNHQRTHEGIGNPTAGDRPIGIGPITKVDLADIHGVIGLGPWSPLVGPSHVRRAGAGAVLEPEAKKPVAAQLAGDGRPQAVAETPPIHVVAVRRLPLPVFIAYPDVTGNSELGQAAREVQFAGGGIGREVLDEVRPELLGLLVGDDALLDEHVDERTAVLGEEGRCPQ